MKNKLSLKTERLAELSTDDLVGVQAAAPTQTPRSLLDCIVIGNIPTLHGCTTNILCP